MRKMVRIGRILEVHPLDAKYRRREMLEGYTCQTCADKPDLWDNRDGLEGFLTGEIQMRNSNEKGKRGWIDDSDFFLAVKIEWIATFPEEVVG